MSTQEKATREFKTIGNGQVRCTQPCPEDWHEGGQSVGHSREGGFVSVCLIAPRIGSGDPLNTPHLVGDARECVTEGR